MPAPRFAFRCDAVAIGGHLTRPERVSIESVAAKVPLLGGTSSLEAGARTDDTISFRRARVRASGFVDAEGQARSESLSMIEHLSIGGRVTLDSCSASVLSFQARDAKVPRLELASLAITGLALDGYSLYADISIQAELGSTSQIKLDESIGLLHLGAHLRWAGNPNPRAYIDRNVVRLEGFGSVHFGEVIAGRDFLRVCALRFELGSPMEGHIECASSKGGSISLF